MSETPVWFMAATFMVLALFFVVDLIIIGRKPHIPSTKECVQHIAFFVAMALIFGGAYLGLCWIATCHRILFRLAHRVLVKRR